MLNFTSKFFIFLGICESFPTGNTSKHDIILNSISRSLLNIVTLALFSVQYQTLRFEVCYEDVKFKH